MAHFDSFEGGWIKTPLISFRLGFFHGNRSETAHAWKIISEIIAIIVLVGSYLYVKRRYQIKATYTKHFLKETGT